MIRKILAGIFIFVVFFLAFIVFYLHLTIPQKKGVIHLKGIRDSVIVKFDRYGIPWIRAKNIEDLFFAQGFIHAEHRLFQMDLYRRIAEGRLSEIFGEKTFKVDSFFRVIGIKKNCEILLDSLFPIERQILEAYSKGVNAFIEKRKGLLPPEFLILRYVPGKWIPLNTIEVGRLMGWDLNLSYKGDLLFTEIKNKKGEEVLEKVLPLYPEDAPFHGDDIDLKKELKEVEDIILILENFYKPKFTSNACATGNPPFLMNDPHLEFSFPPAWFFNILQIDTLVIKGFSVPGAPLVVPGTNSKIALGVTSLCLDEGDFVKLKKENIDTVWEEIKVKDEVKKTKVLLKDNLPVIKEYKDSVFVYFWRGFLPSHEIYAIYNVYLSEDVIKAREFLKYFKIPSLNFIMADNSGNILYQPCGWIERKKEVLVFPRHDLPGDFLSFDEIPFSLNPEKGYIFSSNNPPFRDFPHYISIYFSPSGRARRYERVLGSAKDINFEFLKDLQNDVKSEFAKFLVKKLVDALREKNLNKKEEKALNFLEEWDFSFDKNRVAPYIYANFETSLIKEFFLPLLGDTLYKKFISFAYVSISALERNLKKNKIPDSVLISAFKNALKNIKFEKYGKYAKAKFKHAFSQVPLLKVLFTKGPLSVSGSPTTPNKMGYLISKPFDIIEGPSMRMIVNLEEDEIYVVLPPGESGHFLDRNSDDQLKLWERGEYIKIEEEKFNQNLLILP